MCRSISLLLISASLSWGQLKIQFPDDSPISAVVVDQGATGSIARGSAVSLEVHAALSLRNNSTQRIRAVTLLVTAAELTAGGKASVSVPSLDIKPGETFPIRIDLRLLRPGMSTNAPVQVSIDGVLFDMLNFYGPNKLNSRRAMLAWELEARRDRKFFLDALMQGGQDGLRREMIVSLTRQDTSPRMDVQVVRGRSTNAENAQAVQFATLDLPGAPVEILEGSAMQVNRDVSSPKFELQNRSQQPVRFIELGWSARGVSGGALPASISLAPGERKSVEQPITLQFPTAASSLSAYVASVEYGDGTVWIPARNKATRVSPEEQRLSEIYRRKGLDALATELRKFQ